MTDAEKDGRPPLWFIAYSEPRTHGHGPGRTDATEVTAADPARWLLDYMKRFPDVDCRVDFACQVPWGDDLQLILDDNDGEIS